MSKDKKKKSGGKRLKAKFAAGVNRTEDHSEKFAELIKSGHKEIKALLKVSNHMGAFDMLRHAFDLTDQISDEKIRISSLILLGTLYNDNRENAKIMGFDLDRH